MKYLIMLLGAALGAVGLSIETLFSDWYALVGGTVVIVQALKAFPPVKDRIAIVVSWGTGFLLTTIGHFGALGFLGEFTTLEFFALGASVSLASNGFYAATKHVLVAIGLLEPKE